jgi:hypothetical protein
MRERNPFVNVRVGDMEIQGMLLLELDGGDTWVNVADIAAMQKLPVDGPGDRTKIILASGATLTVPESLLDIRDTVQRMLNEFAGGMA